MKKNKTALLTKLAISIGCFFISECSGTETNIFKKLLESAKRNGNWEYVQERASNPASQAYFDMLTFGKTASHEEKEEIVEKVIMGIGITDVYDPAVLIAADDKNPYNTEVMDFCNTHPVVAQIIFPLVSTLKFKRQFWRTIGENKSNMGTLKTELESICRLENQNTVADVMREVINSQSYSSEVNFTIRNVAEALGIKLY